MDQIYVIATAAKFIDGHYVAKAKPRYKKTDDHGMNAALHKTFTSATNRHYASKGLPSFFVLEYTDGQPIYATKSISWAESIEHQQVGILIRVDKKLKLQFTKV